MTRDYGRVSLWLLRAADWFHRFALGHAANVDHRLGETVRRWRTRRLASEPSSRWRALCVRVENRTARRQMRAVNRWRRWALGPLSAWCSFVDLKRGRSRRWKKSPASRLLRIRDAYREVA